MTTRRIDVSGEDRLGGLDAPRPVLDWIRIEALIVDGAYQREIEKRGWKAIRRIAQNFDWGRFSPLLVSHRFDGTFAVIDGQHRAHAAALRGVEAVPALVVRLTPQEEASAFAWVNGEVTALTPVQVYRAALAAMEPWAVQCDAVVARAGCRLLSYQLNAASRKAGDVTCIGVIRKAVAAKKSAAIVAALSGLRAAPCGASPQNWTANYIAALIEAAHVLGVTRGAVIEDFLVAHPLPEIEREVRRVMARPEFSGKGFKVLFGTSTLALMRSFLRREVG